MEICHNLCLVTIWVLEFCHNVSFFCHNWSFWVWSQFNFCNIFSFFLLHNLSFFTSWLFKVSSQFFFNSFFYNLRFLTILVFEYCHLLRLWVFSPFEFLNLSQFEFLCLSQFEFLNFYHNLSFWVFFFFSQFEVFIIIKIRVFEFIHNLIFFSFITIWVFEFHPNLNFGVSSHFEFLSFITIWVFEFHHNLSF